MPPANDPFTERLRLFRGPLTVASLVVLADFPPRLWLALFSGQPMATAGPAAPGGHALLWAVLAACAIWMLAAAFAPVRLVKPIGIAALMTPPAVVYAIERWTLW